jgi:hypothetical protein
MDCGTACIVYRSIRRGTDSADTSNVDYGGFGLYQKRRKDLCYGNAAEEVGFE